MEFSTPMSLTQEIQNIKDLLFKDFSFLNSKDFKGHCKACQEPIHQKSTSVTLKDVTIHYHPQCFICFGCSKPLNQFYTHQNNNYCQECYHLQILGKCDTCHQIFTNTSIVKVSTKQFHPKCFCCYKCKNPIDGVYIEKDGYLCKGCYEQDFMPYCDRCSQAIQPDSNHKLMAIEWNEKKYHVSCFSCYVCQAPFSDLKAILHKEGLVCKPCFETLK